MCAHTQSIQGCYMCNCMDLCSQMLGLLRTNATCKSEQKPLLETQSKANDTYFTDACKSDKFQMLQKSHPRKRNANTSHSRNTTCHPACPEQGQRGEGKKRGCIFTAFLLLSTHKAKLQIKHMACISDLCLQPHGTKQCHLFGQLWAEQGC